MNENIERSSSVGAPASGHAAPSSAEARMEEILARQRRAQIDEGPPPAELRVDRLRRLTGALVDLRHEIVEALAEDFGHRSRDASLYTDVGAIIVSIKFAQARLARWMKPERRRPQIPLGLLGARAEVRFQPLGVVGIVSPWNFPVHLAFAPLACAIAAGNRAMIKPSEVTPRTAEVIRAVAARAFDEAEVAVVTGGVEVGRAFTALPFDHLIFTGSAAVARHVVRASAEHLVPLTLELGGKCPVIVGKGADLRDVGAKVMSGKCLNAGQICLSPDYVLVPEGRRAELVEALRAAVAAMYPTLRDNPDYTSVVNERSRRRLERYLEDARAKGGEIVEINPGGESFAGQEANKMPPALVLDPTEDMLVSREEIFGPILPIRTYRTIGEAIDYVNAHERPLALYYFGPDHAEREQVLSRTTSGGVTVDDVAMHALEEDLPFGGVGPSGMGVYRGRDGFRRFSHARAVFTQAPIDVTKALRPPYGPLFRRLVGALVRR